MLEGWAPADRASLAQDLMATCEKGAATYFIMEASADNTRRVQLETILLPLMHADSAIGRVIGAISAITSPHWLGHDHLRDKRLVAHDLIWPDGRPNSAIGATAQPGAAPSSDPVGIARGDRRNFRVLDGGRKED